MLGKKKNKKTIDELKAELDAKKSELTALRMDIARNSFESDRFDVENNIRTELAKLLNIVGEAKFLEVAVGLTKEVIEDGKKHKSCDEPNNCDSYTVSEEPVVQGEGEGFVLYETDKDGSVVYPSYPEVEKEDL